MCARSSASDWEDKGARQGLEKRSAVVPRVGALTGVPLGSSGGTYKKALVPTWIGDPKVPGKVDLVEMT
ncbi:hypothetical protein B296_00050239 [Ensete ventricosum]|uniref:Uncharacterized protein n=1 Tax=Ensete ventricosum TaxID=4639 RepID=A0A426YM96_ENSVE|nr:hypothetical protein B296_00050239 [Ensete ventricosum]